MPELGIMNQSCVVLRAAKLVDRYGAGNKRDWPNAVETPLGGVSIQPSSTNESVEDRQTTVSGWRFYGPADTDLRATDRIRSDLLGMTFEVVGDPQPWPDPLSGGIDHWEAPLEIVKPDPTPGV